MISLMDRYDWNTFSLIIDPRLPGEDELINEFEEHGNEQRNWSDQSLSLSMGDSLCFLAKKRRVNAFISKDKRSKRDSCQPTIFLVFLLRIRLTILSIIRMKSINPIHIKQQLAMMNAETRVIIVHTTSYVRSSVFRSKLVDLLRLQNFSVDHRSTSE